jgi:hypothetical protein
MLWKETSHRSSRYNPSNCLEELQKTTKQLSLHSECPGQDLTRALSKYKSRITTLAANSCDNMFIEATSSLLHDSSISHKKQSLP